MYLDEMKMNIWKTKDFLLNKIKIYALHFVWNLIHEITKTWSRFVNRMDQKERRALDRCFDSFLHDLDPSTSFLHSLYAEGVLTEEQMDKINVSRSCK